MERHALPLVRAREARDHKLMTFSQILGGKRILFLEDSYFLRAEIRDVFVALGATIVGPFHEVDTALAAVLRGDADAAILEAEFAGDFFPLADVMEGAGIPYVIAVSQGSRFVTGSGFVLSRNPAYLDAIAKALFGRGVGDASMH